MGAFLGLMLGGTLAMFFTGRLAAWIIRKISGAANNVSYLIGLTIMTFVGAWSITYDGGPTGFLENWIMYVITGLLAFSLMIVRDRRKQRPST
jgi:hypothetical protein